MNPRQQRHKIRLRGLYSAEAEFARSLPRVHSLHQERGVHNMETVRIELPIYTFQIDFSGHVSNVVYIQWLEICRLTLLERAGLPVHAAARAGVLPVLTDTVISYKHPLYLGDTVLAEFWISELGGASAWVEYRLTNGAGTLCASARQRGLWVNAETKRPARITPEQRALFEPFLALEGEKGD